MKKIILCILSLSLLISCASMRFEPRLRLAIAPISTIESNLNLNLVSAGNSLFTHIQNDSGMVNVSIHIATFSKNAENTVLVTEAVAFAPEKWTWEFGPTKIYGAFADTNIALQGKNFELSLFLQSGESNIYRDLFTKETLPKQWLVCQASRLENFNKEKIILDYREVAPDLALSPLSPELQAFKQRAIAYFEQMVLIASPQKIEGYPKSLATRFLGSFVGQLRPEQITLPNI